MNNSTLGLIVFVKNNELGKVKTRIAKDVGDARASEIYSKLVDYTMSIVAKVPVPTFVMYSDVVESSDSWTMNHITKSVQGTGDIGARMRRACMDTLASKKKIVLIGSDCPQIKSYHILQAFSKLKTYDIVLGPSYDGGYYLVAMNKDATSIFDGMQWSHENVLNDTIQKAKQAGLSYTLLEKLHDVDYWDDVVRYCKHL